MLQYAIGELRRIPDYAAEGKGFCVLPDDFPHELVQSVATLEPSFVAALDMQQRAKRARWAERAKAAAAAAGDGVVV